jgi:ketosteroid isomerase-like protein
MQKDKKDLRESIRSSAKYINFPVAARCPKANVNKASTRFLNRFGDNGQLSAAVQKLRVANSKQTGSYPGRKIEMKKLMLVLFASACCTAFAMNASAQQQADKATADAVIAMTKAQWAAEIKDPTNVAEQMKDASDDYTEFNGDYATRLDGKTMNSQLAEAAGKASSKTIAAEMANPKVQVYDGNVAILTYNYAGVTQDKDGKTEPVRAKSTRVFVKMGKKWMLVHANFGADPAPKQ